MLATYPERKRLSLPPLHPDQDKAWTMLFWRKGAGSPMITALAEILKTAANRKPRAGPGRMESPEAIHRPGESTLTV